ncbi:hypothetical protein [Burkholderia guangdongensis]|uniref:hypothetical protein n=1 Tax=Burkholderia guangdongensis TaxID=1792500 RepID=UPI001FE9BBE7|nr:hypothetical protein [Burkholderia guangdongensis]
MNARQSRAADRAPYTSHAAHAAHAAQAAHAAHAVHTAHAARLVRATLVALCAAAAVPHAFAQNVPLVGGIATIETGVAYGATGAVAVNETAGLDNVQGNQMVFGMGAPGAGSIVSTQAAVATARAGETAAHIEGSAFSNVTGAVMVNQSAGVGNLQRNSAVLGTLGAEVQAVSDTELSETAARQSGLGLPEGGRDRPEVSISSDAFKHISGIVQVNQTSGAGNATANVFVLRPPAGTLFN